MSRILVLMTYDVKPRKRQEFLKWTKRVKKYIRAKYKQDYSFFEHKDKKNRFTEVFVCKTKKDYEKIQDLHDAKIDQFIWEMDKFIGDREKCQFQMLIELK